MTITRIWQTGAELNTVLELEELTGISRYSSGGSNAVVVTTTAYTGTSSFRFRSASRPLGKAFSSRTQIRCGYFLRWPGPPTTGAATNTYPLCIVLGNMPTTGDIVVLVRGQGDFEIWVNGVEVASTPALPHGFFTADRWMHIGVHVKAHATTGFVSLYIDGVQILTWTGNTSTSLTGAYFGGRFVTGNGWSSDTFMDDFILDDTTGEPDGPVPSPRLYFGVVNAAGAATNLTPNTGSNFQAVDETTPDGDTTYVAATAASVKDSYGVADATVLFATAIVAVIAAALVRRTDAGINSQWQLGLRSGAGTEVLGSAQGGLSAVSYLPIYERQTTEPGGAAWTQTKVNDAQVVLQSAGSF